jgi:hypothetical protein
MIVSIATKPPEPATSVTGGVRAYTVTELAQRYVVKPHTILALIAAGELKAIDISAPGAKRPHWRIMPSDLAAFELRRSAVATEPATTGRQKRKPSIDLIDPTTGRIARRFRVVGSTKGA